VFGHWEGDSVEPVLGGEEGVKVGKTLEELLGPRDGEVEGISEGTRVGL
jgi:hypothetical protein